MPPRDEQLRRFLASSSLGYAIGGLYMLFARGRMERDFKRIDRKAQPPEHLWNSLAVAYMATIAAVAWVSSRDRLVAKRMLPTLLVAKGVTTGLFAYRFARTGRPSYAISAATDGGLLAAMLLLSRDRSSHGV